MNSILKNRLAQDIIVYGTIAIIGGFIIYLIAGAAKTSTTAVTETPVHWHAHFTYNVCGEKLKLTDYVDESSVIHSHNDELIHIEGIVLNNEQITLEKFIKSTRQDIDNTHFQSHKNGDLCGNKPGKVTFYLNDTPYYDASQIVIADDQEIRITFE